MQGLGCTVSGILSCGFLFLGFRGLGFRVAWECLGKERYGAFGFGSLGASENRDQPKSTLKPLSSFQCLRSSFRLTIRVEGKGGIVIS